MFKWESVIEWGRRASDKHAPAPVTPVKDQLLESLIAHEQIEVLYQPQIEPGTGRIVGAEALARSPVGYCALFAARSRARPALNAFGSARFPS